MAGLSGCGTNNGFFGQPSQTYTITVTATSGTLSHATTVTLTIE
jgi:trimeric autotransporter adhesin